MDEVIIIDNKIRTKEKFLVIIYYMVRNICYM